MFLMSSAFDFDIYRLWCVDWHITRLAKNGFKLFLAEFLFKKIIKIGKKKKNMVRWNLSIQGFLINLYLFL